METGDTKPEPVNSDAIPETADWLKRTWDLDLANMDELRAFLAATGTTVEQFKTWPLYRWHVDKPGMEWLKDL
jgi:hypothetical protein